jgi:hypothetical protein
MLCTTPVHNAFDTGRAGTDHTMIGSGADHCESLDEMLGSMTIDRHTFREGSRDICTAGLQVQFLHLHSHR